MRNHAMPRTPTLAAFFLFVSFGTAFAGHPAATDDAGVMGRGAMEFELSTHGNLAGHGSGLGLSLRRGWGAGLDAGLAAAAVRHTAGADRTWSSVLDVKWNPLVGNGPVPSPFVRGDLLLLTDDEVDLGYGGFGFGLTWEYESFFLSAELYSVATALDESFDDTNLGRRLVAAVPVLASVEALAEFVDEGVGDGGFEEWMLGGTWDAPVGILSAGVRWTESEDARHLTLGWTTTWGD